MKKIILLFTISSLFCDLLGSNLNADSICSLGARDSALYYLIHQDYKNAQKLLANYCNQYPEDNEALYLSFVIEQTRILDYESYSDECDSVIAAADSMRIILEKRLKKLKGQDYKNCLLYLANLSGGVSLLYSKKGDWFEAVKSALNSISDLKKVKKLDSNCQEADLGIGVFEYYLSNSFKWIPFVYEKKKEGIRLLENALHARYPYNYAAKNSLCWILIEKGDFRKADSLAKSVLDSFPDNTIFLRIRAYISLWSGKYDSAKNTALHIVKCAESRDPVNWSDMVNGTAILINSLIEQKDSTKAYMAADEFFKKPLPKQFLEYPHLKKNIKQISDVNQNKVMNNYQVIK